ncbi:hypothetical protein B0H16DRAFT_1461170 [Mycena metata]|uniref:Uncharacterized protein n=1 Tax=Mycena metata TaxID=1033252 RepID=A0AAD7IV41_9AGAR|nr:hypothetical protein B0H16DRAFT_1461170 [Mycena metata]
MSVAYGVRRACSRITANEKLCCSPKKLPSVKWQHVSKFRQRGILSELKLGLLKQLIRSTFRRHHPGLPDSGCPRLPAWWTGSEIFSIQVQSKAMLGASLALGARKTFVCLVTRFSPAAKRKILHRAPTDNDARSLLACRARYSTTLRPGGLTRLDVSSGLGTSRDLDGSPTTNTKTTPFTLPRSQLLITPLFTVADLQFLDSGRAE